MNHTKTYCGYVAIVGRPNVGKSTLLNRLLEEKLSITSRKPQTTRHRIIGVKTKDHTQIIFVDTPGLHQKESKAMNRYMNRAARNTLKDVDAVIFVVDSLRWTEEDQMVLDLLSKVNCPIILAVNKIDTLIEKETLLPHLNELSKKLNFREVIPISARKGSNISVLEKKIAEILPESPHYFPENQTTDQTLKFRIAEIIREKLIRILGDELPYSTSVEIETFKEETKLQLIQAIIWVEREGQKPIVIGKEGERLKKIGIRSRQEMEQLLGKKVHLTLWVKVKEGWSDDERALASLGYIDLI